MDYRNGVPEWTAKQITKMDYPKLPTLQKKDNQSLVLMDGPLPSPPYFFCFIYLFFFNAVQLFCRRIHLSCVIADTFGDRKKSSKCLTVLIKHFLNLTKDDF